MTKPNKPGKREEKKRPAFMSNEEQEQRLKAARRAWQKDVVALRLDQDTIEDLTRVAKQRKIGISDLVKQFIADGLDHEK